LKSNLKLLGTPHLLILLAIPLIAVVLSFACRRSKRTSKQIRYILAALVTFNELAWYVYQIHTQGNPFPNGLPLELCNVTLWVAVFAAITLNPFACEIIYYAGLVGSGMALLTPDLWTSFWSYPSFYFFLAHGLVVATTLTLVWGRLARPRSGSPWRVLALVNAYALFIGIFNAIFKTNYMYLCQKPAAVSLLNYLGPWPVYLLGGELIAAVAFWLLWLPFRR
jgi:hypothetical integral membrane protein (TIGR02206 family)